MSATPGQQPAELKVPDGVIRWGDIPVPYVAAWTSESELYIARDPLLDHRPAVFRSGRRGDGKPIFGKMDERRTRRVVIERRCQVCAEKLGPECFVVDVPYAYTRSGAPILNEPAACHRCFAYSVAHCPGIARKLTSPRVLYARVRTFEPVAVTLQPAEDGDAQLNHALVRWRGPTPVIGYVRPAITEFTPLSRGGTR